MNRFLQSIFFIAAGILLAATKSPDVYTVAAVAACALIAALSSSRYAVWSAIGGALLIGASLTLQTALSYRCMDCIKADLLILAGVIYLSVLESGEMKKALRGMTALVTVMLMVNALLHYPVFTEIPLEAAPPGRISQFIRVTYNGRGASLDTSVKPVLLFSPSCGACKTVVEKLAQTDPEGIGWVPVQVDGDPGEGRELLDSAGHQGSRYQSQTGWDEAVPVLVITREGKTKSLYGQEEILKAVRGDNS